MASQSEQAGGLLDVYCAGQAARRGRDWSRLHPRDRRSQLAPGCFARLLTQQTMGKVRAPPPVNLLPEFILGASGTVGTVEEAPGVMP